MNSSRALAAPHVHVVNRGIRNLPIFSSQQDYRAFLLVLREALERHPIRLISYCVLPEHWHLVLELSGRIYLPGFMGWVTATHAARRHEREKTTERLVYQDHFAAEPIDQPDELIRICRHVERNALRAGLVRRAEDWPWCSLAERLQPETMMPLVPARFLASPAWIDYVNAPPSPGEEAARREHRLAESLGRSAQTTWPTTQADSPA